LTVNITTMEDLKKVVVPTTAWEYQICNAFLNLLL